MSHDHKLQLASLAAGRDGSLVVVAADHRRFLPAPSSWPTMQAALDDWPNAAPDLAVCYEKLCRNVELGEVLDPNAIVAPLPRAYQWAEASTYLDHMRRIRAARGVQMPPETSRPVFYQSGGAEAVPPRSEVPLGNPMWGLDLEATVCVILSDVPRGASRSDAADAIALVGLTNDLTYRRLMGQEYRNGVGPYTAKPPRPYAPIVASPAALGQAWRNERLYARLEVAISGQWLGTLDTAAGSDLGFDEIVAAATMTRPLVAGTILGSGTVSNPHASAGFGCIAEKLAINGGDLDAGPYLLVDDRIQIEAFGDSGSSLFGTIDTTIVEGPT